MRPHYSIVTQPETEPITYAQLSSHVRVDSTDDEAYVTALISVAREWVDKVTGRASIEAEYKLTADSWKSIGDLRDGIACEPLNIQLYRTPLVSVEAVKYYEPDAVALTTMSTDDYRVITGTEPGMISIFQNLPTVDDRPDAIQIEFTAGHEDADAVSALQKHAVKLMAATLYENRMPLAPVDLREIPYTLQTIINSIKAGGWLS